MTENVMFLEDTFVHGTVRYPFCLHETHESDEQSIKLYLHWHKELEFLLVLDGAAVFHIEDREYVVKKNEGIFVHANYLHDATTYNNMPCHFFAFVFHPMFLCDSQNNDLYNHYVYPLISGQIHFVEYYTTEIPWQERMITLFRELIPYYDAPAKSCELVVKSKLLEMWHHLFNHPLENLKRNKPISLKLQPVLEYINENYSQDITVEALAEIIPISVSQFCRVFREEMDMSAFTYLVRFRVIKSCSLLVQTEKKITEIAIESGFNNISNYNRAFQKIIGCSPSEYRKEFIS